ncbi:MAG: hypothetical protein AABZ80_04775 [Gemmatimonadota bacterium]
MDDNETPPASDSNAGQAAADAAASSPWRGHLKKWLLIGGITAVVVPVLVFVLWSAITLSYTYSTGYRAGYVQKISRKGWICPTWEGELQMVNLPGAAPERWSFTVRDNIVAASVQSSIGHRVALEYEEHRGVPSTCFGETAYFVIGVRQVPDQ